MLNDDDNKKLIIRPSLLKSRDYTERSWNSKTVLKLALTRATRKLENLARS